MAVCYVTSMTIVCGYFAFSTQAFTNQPSADNYCYATDDSDLPVSQNDPSATNIADNFQKCVEMGFYVHLLGILGDSSFAARVYVKKT